jgi:hypothetical protein
MNSLILIDPDQGSGFKPILSGKVLSVPTFLNLLIFLKSKFSNPAFSRCSLLATINRS